MAEPISPILDALYHGQADAARRLAADAPADSLSIHEAAALGDAETLTARLSADPSAVNAWSSDGFQPLGLACFFGQPAAAALLLAHGADVNEPARHPFHVAAIHAALAGPEPTLARLLVANGADVNARQQGGVTPLQEAAHRGARDLAELLLEHGADPTATDDQARTAADHARAQQHDDLGRWLDERAAAHSSST